MKSEPVIVKENSPNPVAAIAAMVIAFAIAIAILLPVPKPWNLIGFPISAIVLCLVYWQTNKTPI